MTEYFNCYQSKKVPLYTKTNTYAKKLFHLALHLSKISTTVWQVTNCYYSFPSKHC